jgi:peptidoglycan L-alanyl-D-glutamate endopeptidase CwlK
MANLHYQEDPMAFALGNASKQKLVGVHPIIARVVERAIQISEQDFGVFEGVRTLERQKKLVAAGASKTLRSMHIPQKDMTGASAEVYGHAVDLVPWIDGQFRWEWGPCYAIAAAMDAAATEQGVAQRFCWGGVWDRWLSDYGGNSFNMKQAVLLYQARHPGPDFVDGPHFQIGRLG